MRELTFQEIKQSELKSLILIDQFCRKHNLRYWIAYGTLLGAVRHKGFIPWDDDIDVCMPRSDYDFFVSNFNKENSDRKVITVFNTNDYYLNSAKVIDENTVLIEEVDSPIEIGCFVDVFPMDYLPDNCEKAESHVKKIKKRYKFINYLSTPIRKDWGLFKKIAWYLFKIVKPLFSRKKEIKKISKMAQKFNKKYNRFWALLEHETLGYNSYLDSHYWSETVMLEFEGRAFCAPKEYDKVLTAIYGDYLVLPPKEKRVTHHNFKCWWRSKA